MIDEQIKNCPVPTAEIESDIAVTETEIKNMRDELEVVTRNLTENKLRIYVLEGGIVKREDFVASLKKILAYRAAQFN